jgi:hypothetical protein
MSENMERFRGIDGSDGIVDKPHIHIIFQHGPVADGINGCRIEDVIEVLQERLLDHQGRGLACEENATALYHLEAAHDALLIRRRRREKQGVIDTDKPHVSESFVVA